MLGATPHEFESRILRQLRGPDRLRGPALLAFTVSTAVSAAAGGAPGNRLSPVLGHLPDEAPTHWATAWRYASRHVLVSGRHGDADRARGVSGVGSVACRERGFPEWGSSVV